MSRETWELVYQGFYFEPANNSRGHSYFRIEIDDKEKRRLGRHLNMKKELLPAAPGAILRVEVEVETDGQVSIYTRGREYAGQWTDDVDTVRAWAAMDRAHSSLANAARSAKVDEFEKTLLPIRTAYFQLNGPQRAALLVNVVRFITGSTR